MIITLNCSQCETEIKVDSNRYKLCNTCKIQNQRNRSKQYKASNRQHVSDYNKIYKNENKEDISSYNNKYFQENKDAINTRRVGYHKKYYKKYPNAKIIASYRGRMKSILEHDKNKYSSLEVLGCSKKFFTAWLEWQFDDKQTIKNHGSVWHLDHCLPCTFFDVSKYDDVKRCFHWSNIQPLAGNDNVSKGNKTSNREQFMQIIKIKSFIHTHGDKYKDEYTLLDYNRFHYIKELN